MVLTSACLSTGLNTSDSVVVFATTFKQNILIEACQYILAQPHKQTYCCTFPISVFFLTQHLNKQKKVEIHLFNFKVFF